MSATMDIKTRFYSKRGDTPNKGHTVTDLKDMCKALGLNVSGSKKELCDRLKAYFARDTLLSELIKESDIHILGGLHVIPPVRYILSLPSYDDVGYRNYVLTKDAQQIVDTFIRNVAKYLVKTGLSAKQLSVFLIKTFGEESRDFVIAANAEHENKKHTPVITADGWQIELSHYITGLVYKIIAQIKYCNDEVCTDSQSQVIVSEQDVRKNINSDPFLNALYNTTN